MGKYEQCCYTAKIPSCHICEIIESMVVMLLKKVELDRSVVHVDLFSEVFEVTEISSF